MLGLTSPTGIVELDACAVEAIEKGETVMVVREAEWES